METNSKAIDVFKIKPVRHIQAKNVLNPKFNYRIANVAGNCMNDINSPIQLKPNDKVIIHDITNESNHNEYKNKIVCFMLRDGQFFIKEFISKDILFYNFKMYNPLREFSILIGNVIYLYLVDDIVK